MQTYSGWSVDICFIRLFLLCPLLALSLLFSRFFCSAIFFWLIRVSRSYTSTNISSFCAIEVNLIIKCIRFIFIFKWNGLSFGMQQTEKIIYKNNNNGNNNNITAFTLNILKVLHFLWFPVFSFLLRHKQTHTKPHSLLLLLLLLLLLYLTLH